jgi:hypothetical protein
MMPAMKAIERLGLIIGVAVGALAWLQSIRIQSSPISVFPDFLTLGIFAALSFGALLYELRRHPEWTRWDVAVASSRFGYRSGLVIAAITSVRALVQWSEPRYWMVALIFPFSLIAVLIVTFFCGVVVRMTAPRTSSPAA